MHYIITSSNIFLRGWIPRSKTIYMLVPSLYSQKQKHIIFEQVNHFNMHSIQEMVAFKDHMSSTSLASPLHWAQTKELFQVKPKSTNLDHLESAVGGGLLKKNGSKNGDQKGRNLTKTVNMSYYHIKRIAIIRTS